MEHLLDDRVVDVQRDLVSHLAHGPLGHASPPRHISRTRQHDPALLLPEVLLPPPPPPRPTPGPPQHDPALLLPEVLPPHPRELPRHVRVDARELVLTDEAQLPDGDLEVRRLVVHDQAGDPRRPDR